ncbi:MAG: hypothetical protein FJ112_10745 [Deltaproteobacteria bacterium]|nr:hypothetical protein [Deltaproteobacteria bacterium]
MCLFFLLNLGSCGSKDSYKFWGESMVGVMSGAVWVSQGTGVLPSGLNNALILLPSAISCPLLTETEDFKAQCLGFANDKITTSPGKYLRRYLGLCQFEGAIQPSWFRTFHRIEFPSQDICEAINSSAGGLTAANIGANSLIGQTIKINFGLGANGDQQNIAFSQKGHVQYLWTDFPTGFLEAKIGGIEVEFNAINERVINLKGVQVKNFIPKNEEINNPEILYGDIVSIGALNVLALSSDRTISSIQAGDRKFERDDASLDFQWGESHPMEVKFSGSTPVILTGAKIRTQYNNTGMLSLSEVTQDLRFGNLNCCWPTSGQITTQFNSLYILPTVRRKTFETEIVDFTSECGQISLTQSGGNSADEVPARTLTLDQCF